MWAKEFAAMPSGSNLFTRVALGILKIPQQLQCPLPLISLKDSGQLYLLFVVSAIQTLYRNS